MSETQRQQDDIRLKNEKSWLGLLAKIIFFMSAFVIVILTVMANMGGSNETLKSGVTQFTSRIFSGRPVTLDRLVNMKFFPSVGVDFEGLHVHPYNGSSENLVNVGKFKFYTSFWDVLIGAQKFKGVYATDITVKEGMWGDRAFSAESILVNHDVATGEAQLRGKGKIGVYDWSFVFDLEVSGFAGDYTFYFADTIPFKIELGDVTLTGDVQHYNGDYITLKNLVVARKDKQILGEVSISVLGELALKIKGHLKVNDADGVVSLDIDLDRSTEGKPELAGSIKAVSLTQADLNGDHSLFAFVGRLLEVTSFSNLQEPILSALDFGQHYNLDLNIDMQAFETEKEKDNSLIFSIVKMPDYARFSKISGKIDGVSVDVPDLYFSSEGENMIAIVQGGKFNPAFIDYAQHSLPAGFVKAQAPLDIRCGLGSFEAKKDGQSMNGISLDTTQGKVGHGAKPQSFLLNGKAYDFISSSLKAVSNDNPCLAYITRKEEPKAEVPVPAAVEEAKPSPVEDVGKSE